MTVQDSNGAPDNRVTKRNEITLPHLETVGSDPTVLYILRHGARDGIKGLARKGKEAERTNERETQGVGRK